MKPPPMAAPKKKTTNIKAIQYYAADSAEVLAVKKAFKLPEKTEQIIDEYISKIKEELANINIVKKQEKEDEINHKAEVLQHVMNQEKMDIG